MIRHDEPTDANDESLRRDPITLRDLIIMLVALGVGLAYSRAFHSIAAEFTKNIRGMFLPLGLIPNHAAALLVTLLLPVGTGLCVLRLIRPWPDGDRLTTEPGFVATLATSVVWLGSVAIDVALRLPPALPGARRMGLVSDVLGHVLGLSNRPMFAVLAVWVVLRLGGRWRARPTWLDRAGRILGGLWFVQFLLLQWTLAFSI